MAEYYNLLDHAKQFSPNGDEYAVVKILEQSNPVIKDMPVIESNDESGHTYAVQTGIPEGTWRRAYEGVEPTKHTQKVVHDTYGRMSTTSIVDVAVAEKGGKIAETRAAMAEAHLEGMAQGMAKKVFYGSNADNEKSFIGLAPRFSALSGAESSANVISNGGSSAGAQSSIYLVGWGKNKTFGFYPKGTRAGIKRYDFSANGPVPCELVAGKVFPGYKEQYEWLMGLAVADWRYSARLCNIQAPTSMDNDAFKALFKNFMKAVNQIHNVDAVNLVAYCSRDVKFALRNGFLLSGGTLAPQVYMQNEVTQSGNKGYANHDLVIDGIHVKADDAIVQTEAVVA